MIEHERFPADKQIYGTRIEFVLAVYIPTETTESTTDIRYAKGQITDNDDDWTGKIPSG